MGADPTRLWIGSAAVHLELGLDARGSRRFRPSDQERRVPRARGVGLNVCSPWADDCVSTRALWAGGLQAGAPVSVRPSSEADLSEIRVVGAREHNLKGVSVSIPRDSLTVITGLSGSGKSSLAFDTIYQEGQRRFMESLSAYARQFLGSMEKPRVDRVDGLSPTLCIDQKTVNRNPRSTVGTVTEILDHLRLLLARLGTPRCPECHTVLSRSTPGQVVEGLLRDHPDARIVVMAPIVQERKGEYRKELADALSDGWLRARIDGEMMRLDEPISLARYEKHTIELVVDRLKARPDARSRFVEAVERAAEKSDGTLSLLIHAPDAGPDAEPVHRLVSMDRTCPDHGVSAPELEPRLFSFNAPQGMCPDCSGIGFHEDFDPELLLDLEAPFDRAVGPLRTDEKLPFSSIDRAVVRRMARKMGIAKGARLGDLTPVQRHRLLEGDATLSYTTVFEREGRRQQTVREWGGVAAAVRNIWHYTKLPKLKRYRRRVPCSGCKGARLHPLALAVDFRGHDIASLSSMKISEAQAFYAQLALTPDEQVIGGPIVRELAVRLGFLEEVGLGYLGIDRSSATLSGGEAQRIRLAAQVGAGLQGITYVLDEPSIGLHGRDQVRLLGALQRLRDKGNTVVVVEHDPITMARADWLVEVGPGAGVEGGEVVAQGAPARFLRSNALTARYLRGAERIRLPEHRRPADGPCLAVRGASENNLQDVDLEVPIGTLTVITGVSGSGKSTLVERTLHRAVAAHHQGATARPGTHRAIEGLDLIDKVVRIDQAPIGRTPRSNPATYTGLFDPIRTLFAQLPESRARGYSKGRFSFNVAGGRCEECKGAGVVTVEMQFLSDVQIPCEVCNSARFNAETLDIRYRGRTISDVLGMSIASAREFFSRHRKISRILSVLCEVGLGYVELGQPSTTLSGGEAQRIKLATELARPATGQTLYILDEPTTGLHMADVGRLLHAMQRLVDAGNTVLVIEHDTDVIKSADHVVDLGPEGGDGGGRILATGTPEHIAMQDSPTGHLLAGVLAREAELDEEEAGLSRAASPLAVYGSRARRTSVRHPDITVRGAQTHNLRSVDIDLPKGKLIVVTGPSGSGKTSLAFDTIFAEGQRRYVESLSTYARRFLGRMERPPVDKVEGLAPAIAIDQRNRGGNPRSTVATTTEIYDQLRLLYARVGQPHCPECAVPLVARSPGRAARELQAADPGTGWLLCTVPPDTRLGDLRAEGFARVWDGRQLDLEVLVDASEAGPDTPVGDRQLVVDRFSPARVDTVRLTESIATAYGWGSDRAVFHPRSRDGTEHVLSRRPECPEHGAVLPDELTPRHFSFNSHWGACPDCTGLGRRTAIDLDLLVADPSQPLAEALDPQVGAHLYRSARNRAVLAALFAEAETDDRTPFRALPAKLRRVLLSGRAAPVSVTWSRTWAGRTTQVEEAREWGGIRELVDGWGKRAERLRRETTCPSCDGGRLKPWVRGVTLGQHPAASDGQPAGIDIATACRMTVERAREFWSGLELSAADQAVAAQPVEEMVHRLSFLEDVGLGYLTLDRGSSTLSGGEAQRIRLATQLGARLTGTIYVLDEPTIGLHPRDTERLLGTLAGLRDLGNTLLVVEHDAEVMRAADVLVDMGPGAGEHGGRVTAQGTPEEVAAGDSLTGDYLSGRRAIALPASRRTPRSWIELPPCSLHTLRAVEARFPRGAFTVVTGVSGSGKSTLVMEHLVPFLDAEANRRVPRGEPKPERLVVVDQRPIGRSPRSTPATYCNIWDPIRTLFAQTRLSRERGWTKGRFSWNTAGGRCEACEGRGSVLVEMHFLSDVWITCEACGGRRFSRQTLEARWKELSIADVLDLTVEDAVEVFRNQRRILKRIRAMHDVGLGYLRLGQAATTLSGGEAQRMKLASELVARKGPTVFVLDEPTTGLHLADVDKLLAVLQRLVDQGHTVVTIEHHLDVIRCADHLIDMGPEGGAEGGTIVATGCLADIEACPESITGQVLRRARDGAVGAAR